MIGGRRATYLLLSGIEIPRHVRLATGIELLPIEKWTGGRPLLAGLDLLAVQSFLDEHDGGRDGVFSGVWNPTGAEDLSGKFVAQCIFTKIAGKNLQPMPRNIPKNAPSASTRRYVLRPATSL